MVLLASAQIPMGTPAPDFNLQATDGKSYSLDSFSDKNWLVIIFMCVHCPYVQAIEDEIVNFQNDYTEKGVQVVGINPNDAEMYPDDSFEGMQSRAEEKNYNFIYLRDEDQTVAKAYGAVCTPDIYLYDSDRKLAYHGRIEELGKAVDESIAGSSQMPSQGCSIKWKD